MHPEVEKIWCPRTISDATAMFQRPNQVFELPIRPTQNSLIYSNGARVISLGHTESFFYFFLLGFQINKNKEELGDHPTK